MSKNRSTGLIAQARRRRANKLESKEKRYDNFLKTHKADLKAIALETKS